MKINTETIKSLLKVMGYLPEDGVNNIYYKKYSHHNNYIIRVNFNTKKSGIEKMVLRLKMVFNGVTLPQVTLKIPKTLLF